MSHIYYQSPGVLVTDRCFEVRHPVRHRFDLDALYDIRVVRHPLDRTVTTSMHTAGGALVLVAASWQALNSAGAWLVAIILVASPSAASAICLRLRPRLLELRARYHGCVVSLYSSSDARTFGQVGRALIRAREAAVR